MINLINYSGILSLLSNCTKCYKCKSINFTFKNIYLVLCVNVEHHVCVSYVRLCLQKPEAGVTFLKLELQTIRRSHVGAGN